LGLLRFLLALSVLIGHVHGLPGLMLNGKTPYLLHGDTAVQSFYVISGFYMALVLDRVYADSARNPLSFWLSRYLRLAPLYVLISLVTAATQVVATGKVGLYSAGSVFDGAVALLSNLTMLGQDVYVFFGYDTKSQAFLFMPDILRGGLERAGEQVAPGWAWLMIGQGWSIGVELWFYLLAPFIVTRHIGVILAIIAASLAFRIGLALGVGLRFDPWTHRFFPSELMVFLLGSLAYRLYASGRVDWLMERVRWPVFLGMVAITLAYSVIPIGGFELRWIYLGLMALALPSVFSLSKNWRIDRWIGDLSYPIYLWHVLVLIWVHSVGPLRGYACLVVTLALSALCLWLIDRPMDRLRHRLATIRAQRPELAAAQ